MPHSCSSLLARLRNKAKKGQPTPFHGYYYRGFAFVGYPAEYRNSGVRTFVNQEGIVYEKNLGPDTEKLAAEVSGYNLDNSWPPAD